MPFKILIIEDDVNLAYLIQKKLRRMDFDADITHSGVEAIKIIENNFVPSLLLMDYRLVDLSGKEIIDQLHKKGMNIPFIIMTGFGDEKIAVEMMKLGAVDYLVKDQNFLEILIPVVGKVKQQLDIGKRLTETEESLRQSELRFRHLIENSTDMISILDSEGYITYQSPSIELILQYLPDEVLAKNIFSFISKEDLEIIKIKFEEFISRNKKVEHFEFRMIDKDNSIKYVEGTFTNLLSDNNINGILSNLRDITSKVEAEEENKRLSQAINQSPAVIMITDTNGNIVYINPKFTEVTGYTWHETIGKKPSMLKSGVQQKAIYNDLWSTIEAGNTWRGELQNQDKYGKLFWESVSISPVFNKNNKITHYIGVKEDITLKKKNEEKLRRANEFYLTLFEDSPTMIWRCDKNGERNYFNKTWLRFKGTSLEDEVDNNWKSAIHSDDLEKYIVEFSKAFDRREPLKIIYRMQKQSGNFRFINEFCKPFYDIDGYFAGMIGTCLDITETKQAEEAMRNAKEEAEKSEALKTEFLAQMSHEIRTPINAILSFTSLLKYELEDKVEDDLKESFKIIDTGGRRLIRTVDLLLHMSEIQTGNYEKNIKEMNIEKDILDEVIQGLSNFAASREIEIDVDLKDTSPILNADEHSTMQIFENLIDNAIKYNIEGGSINISFEQPDEDNISVLVSDTGIGISKEFLPTLFEPFTQEESGYTRKFEGNGLGLALVKKYCEINNAQIDVSSIKGEGTTFKVTFPR